MWYHLPMVAEWIRAKSIAPVASISLMARGYPGAREAILVWLSLPMDTENLAFLSPLEVPGTCLCVYALCREFDVPGNLSLGFAALFATTPEISMWAVSQKNDLFLTLVFLLLFFFMLRWLRTGGSRFALLAGLSAGLLCATKMSGPGYAATLAAMLLITLALREKAESPAGRLRSIVLMAATAIFVAAPWYLRNLEYFHNPFFPKKVSIFGRILFDGPLDSSFFAPITLGFDFPKLFANWGQFSAELGIALIIMILGPVLLLGLYPWRNRLRIKNETFLWLAVVPMLLLALYMVQPFSLLSRGDNAWQVQPRFLLPLAACLHTTCSFLLSRIPGGARFGLPIMALFALRNLASTTHFWLWIGALALLAALLVPVIAKAARDVDRIHYRFRRFLPAAATVVFVAAVAASHWMDNFREQRKASPDYGYTGGISPGWGEVSLYVRQNIFNKRILCLGRPEDFPLYGRGYTNDLFATDDSYALDLIRTNHIEYVVGFRPFLRHGSKGESWEYLPAATKALRERYPDKFQLVYSSQGAEVVRALE
jgi:hypothetical protein